MTLNRPENYQIDAPTYLLIGDNLRSHTKAARNYVSKRMRDIVPNIDDVISNTLGSIFGYMPD